MRDSRYSAKLTLCLGTIYMVWGSSFLFSKIAVNNLPIALFSAIRFLTAGTLLALLARFWGGHPFPNRPIEWRHVLIAGFFMVFASNGLNTWAIHYIPTNQSALLNGTAAFWIAGLGVFGRRGHRIDDDPEGRYACFESAGAAGGAHRVRRLGARHAVLPQHRHEPELAHVHGHAN